MVFKDKGVGEEKITKMGTWRCTEMGPMVICTPAISSSPRASKKVETAVFSPRRSNVLFYRKMESLWTPATEHFGGNCEKIVISLHNVMRNNFCLRSFRIESIFLEILKKIKFWKTFSSPLPSPEDEAPSIWQETFDVCSFGSQFKEMCEEIFATLFVHFKLQFSWNQVIWPGYGGVLLLLGILNSSIKDGSIYTW